MSTNFPKPFTVLRNTRALIRGVWVDGTPTETVYKGSIQPLSGDDILTLDPASRSRGKVWVYTSSKLTKRVEGSTSPADQVVFEGALWEIIDDRPYSNGLIPHHKYLAEWRSVYVPG